MKYVFSIIGIIVLISGCSTQETRVSESKVLEITENVKDDIIYEMGTIHTGDRKVLELKLKNTLQKPFVINEVIRFCGCTSTEYETAPVLPQKSTIVKFTFHADHMGLFSKSVKIILDTQEKPVQILFRGEIVSPNSNQQRQ